MSSHHFVREGQEPALLILEAVPWGVVGPLLEWAPLVVAAEEALDAVLLWGIKIDAVIVAADGPVVLNGSMLADQGPVKVLRLDTGSPPLIIGLDYLVASQQSAVNIVCADAAPVISAVARHAGGLDISVITATHRWSAIKAGTFKKWLPSGATLVVLGAGVIYADSALPVAGELTIAADGLVSLRSNSGFWIGELL